MGNLCDSLWVNWFKCKPNPKTTILCVYGSCIMLCYVDEAIRLHSCGGDIELKRCDYWCDVRALLPSMVTSRGFTVNKGVK